MCKKHFFGEKHYSVIIPNRNDLWNVIFLLGTLNYSTLGCFSHCAYWESNLSSYVSTPNYYEFEKAGISIVCVICSIETIAI